PGEKGSPEGERDLERERNHVSFARHLHTHHHTHLGMSYNLMSGQFDIYQGLSSRSLVSSQQVSGHSSAGVIKTLDLNPVPITGKLLIQYIPIDKEVKSDETADTVLETNFICKALIHHLWKIKRCQHSRYRNSAIHFFHI
ncbi:hypothetical protein ILYODFUR_027332, partial [Ilyodon furcidens]